MKSYRTLQLLSGIHYIHHIYFSYGHKLAFINIGYFPKYGFKKIRTVILRDNDNVFRLPFHNCTLTGVY